MRERHPPTRGAGPMAEHASNARRSAPAVSRRNRTASIAFTRPATREPATDSADGSAQIATSLHLSQIERTAHPIIGGH
jgi:hypothetical protein